MLKGLDSIFGGQTFSRYCKEINFDPVSGGMFYHRPVVTLRRDRR